MSLPNNSRMAYVFAPKKPIRKGKSVVLSERHFLVYYVYQTVLSAHNS
jgi:hypothetical protein